MIKSKSIICRVGFILLITLQLNAFSQSNYTFTPSVGTYSSISGTDITATISNYTPINLGFTFQFDGVNYTQVVPSKNGWLSFNNTITSTMGNNAYNGNLLNTNCRPLIGVLFTNNTTNGTSKARYVITGTAPSRVFTFEWYYWGWQWYTSTYLSCEIKLYETSNKIECVYNPISNMSSYYCCTSIGLAFTKTGEMLSLSDFSTSPMASNTCESHSFESQPASGLTYTFSPIAVKATPTSQCTNLTASILSDNLSLNWTDAIGSVLPDGYIIMASKTNSFVDPTDGSSITQDNDLADGSGIVKVQQGQQSFSGWKNAESSTNYYLKIFAFSNAGILTKYNKTAVPTTQIKLVKTAPALHVMNLLAKNNAGNYELDWTDVLGFRQCVNLPGRNSDCSTYGPYIYCNNTSALDITGNAITLEAWVNPEQTIGDIFNKVNGALTNGFRLYINTNGQICFGLYSNGTWNELKSATSSIPLNTWSYLGATYDGTTQKIYLNGNLLVSKSTSGNIVTSSAGLAFGAAPSLSKNYFVGKIDEISVWSKARSQAEMLNDMALNIASNETGLVAYFKCNGNVVDASPNAISAYLANSGSTYQASNINSNPDGYLVLASSTNTFPNVINGTDFTTDSDLSDGIGAVKVLPSIQTYSGWTNLDPLKAYTFKIYPYSNKATDIVYNTNIVVPTVTILPEPTNHVTFLVPTPSLGDVALSWIDAVGTQVPDGYLVLVSKTGAFTAPIDGTEITDDKNLADGFGATKVIKGIQTVSGWSNFEVATNYYFRVYPYTNSGTTINYKTNGTIPEVYSSILCDGEATFNPKNLSAANSSTLVLNWKDAFNMNNCLSFDGTDDYITCGTQNSASFTFEAWVNPAIVNTDQAIISTLNEGGLAGAELHIGTTGKPVLTIRNSGAWLDIISSTTISANTWVHLAATYNGSSVILYINGVQVATQTAASYAVGTNTLVIGRRSSSLLNFNGKIDEVRIWNTARSASDINANMSSELLGTETGLMSYYKFNQGTASGSNIGLTTLTDATSNGKNGTLTNFSLTLSTSNWVKANQPPKGYIIKASTTNSFSDPVDLTDITVDNDLSDGAAMVKVPQGLQTYSDWKGLKGQTTYYFKIYAYTNEGIYINYKTTPATPETSLAFVKTKPITHVTDFTAVYGGDKLNLNWIDATEGTPSFGNAIDLDGVNDFVAVPAIGNNLSKFTIETWFKASSLTGNFSGIYNNNNWIAGAVHFQINNGNIELAVAGGATYTVDVSYAFTSNTWYHLATTYNAGVSKIYINGTLVGSGILSTTSVNLAAAQIGAWTTSRYFNGKFDEYRVWNTERSQSDIFNNMYSELTGTESGLLVYYKFNQGVASGNNSGIINVIDASANAKNGTLSDLALNGTTSNWVSTGDIGFTVAAPDGYLIKASKNKNIVAPTNGISVSDDNDLSNDIGAINVLSGVKTYNGWVNQNDTTRYYFKVFPYSNSGTSIIYNTTPMVPTASDTIPISQFKEITTSFPSYAQGASAWVDYDGDGDMDVLVTGGNSFDINNFTVPAPSILYRQNADHSFTSVLTFTGVRESSVAWADYNNDGYNDFILTGWNGSTRITSLYKQNTDHSFTELTSVFPTKVSKGSVAWFDYDNDGDMDILITGQTSTGRAASLYKNNGDGTFTEQTNILLAPVEQSSVACGDYNNDGNIDILLSGFDGTSKITKIYKNNGNTTFTEQTLIVLPGIASGSVAWNDYDNDGDLDILLSGNTNGVESFNPISGLYQNDGKGNFVVQSITGLEGGYGSSVIWGDYNNDGRSDFIITGVSPTTSLGYTTQLFEQNVDHSFTRRTNFDLVNIGDGSANWVDYNNDGNLDLFLTGFAGGTPKYFVTKLYKNTNYKKNIKPVSPTGLVSNLDQKVTLSWNSTTDTETPKKSVSYNLKIGTTASGSEVMDPMALSSGLRTTTADGNCGLNTSILMNLKVGLKYYWSVQAVDNGYLGSAFSATSSFTYDSIPASHLSLKVLNSNSVFAKWSRGNGNRVAVFCKMTSTASEATPLHGVKYTGDSEFGFGNQIGTSGWYCVYNGRADSVTITNLYANTLYAVHVVEYIEESSAPKYYRKVSTNNDNLGLFNTDTYIKQTLTGLDGIGDFNNDGYVDFISASGILKINNGDNTFTQSTAFNLGALLQSTGSVAVGDYNNDGKLDIVVTGNYTNDESFTKLFKNNGDNTFTEQTSIVLTGAYQGSVSWGDYDNDGDLDLLVCGTTNHRTTDGGETQIYTNNYPENSFTLLPNSDFTGIYEGNGEWADYDNDGNLDFAIAGKTNITYDESVHIGCKTGTSLYHNNGDGTFTKVSTYSFDGAYKSTGKTLLWGDYDNDGDLDLKIEGTSACSGGIEISTVYRNDYPDKSFTEQYTPIVFPDYTNKVDYDNDGDLDVIYSVYINRNNTINKFGKFGTNKQPSSPTDLNHIIVPGNVKLEWNSVVTDETFASQMSYNIRIQKKGESKWLNAPNSLNSGYHSVSNFGNVQIRNFANFNLPTGKYYWQVQAIDQAFIGSAWSKIDSIEIKNTQAYFTVNTICEGVATQFNDLSVSADNIITWKWHFGDGETSSLKNPSHIYTQGKTYTANLEVTSSSGITDSYSQNVTVIPKPYVGFTVNDVCDGYTAVINNTTVNNGLVIDSWKWDFGDTKNSGLQVPVSHTYDIRGVYYINLKAIANNGCTDSVQHKVAITETPNPTFTLDYGRPSFCKGDSVQYSVQLNANYSYQWLRDGDNINETTNSLKVKEVSGNYSVLITNKLSNTCSASSLVKTITVKDSPSVPVLSAESETTFCMGDSVKINAGNLADVTFSWSRNQGPLASDLSYFIAKESGSYALVTSFTNGCSSKPSQPVIVTVNNNPSLPSVSYGETSICHGGSVNFSVNSSSLNLQWFYNNEPVTGATSNIFSAAKSGEYFLQLTNTNLCSNKTSPVSVSVNELPEKPLIAEANSMTSYCLGTEIKLLVTNSLPSLNYQWKRSGVPIDGATLTSYQGKLTGGDYRVQVRAGNCASESDVLTLTTKPAPPKPNIYAWGPNVWIVVCDNTSANDYRWYYNDQLIVGAKTNQFVAKQNLGNYYVEINDGGECYTSSDIINIPTGNIVNGIEDLISEIITVSPNPTNGLSTINLGNTLPGILNVEIIDAQGKKFNSYQFRDIYNFSIDLTEAPIGVYLCKISYKNSMIVKKIVKQ